MRRLLAALLFCVLAAPLSAQDDEAAQPEVVGGDWLVLDGVDSRGRQPFNPDAVFARYLLDLPVQAPAEGELIRGTRGTPQTWRKVSAGEDGRIGGGIAYAYRSFESDRDRVVLAALSSGSTLFVNEGVYAGDIYGMKSGPVPVTLREGVNHIFVRGVRGKFRLTFEEVTSKIMFTGRDHTTPDLVRGEDASGEVGVTVVNTSTTKWLSPAIFGTVGIGSNAWRSYISKAPEIAPLGVLKLPVKFGIPAAATLAEEGAEPPDEVELNVIGVADPTAEWIRAGLIGPTIKLRVRDPEQPRKITFRSSIDDSVQYYAVRQPTGEARGVVLSLHGAGVQAPGQARSYGPKEDLWILAPTNRRRFGFDWQDWGRRDAYEALEHLLTATGVDRAAVYLSGHSMGGHGTWHLAANDPDRFRAIAPSAGWSQFDHYGGRPDAALQEPWLGADRASDTMSLMENLRQLPTFVLHGDKDDNVPLSEAERMLTTLRAHGAAPRHHFEPGAGHWWDVDKDRPGADCLDWPGIFELFAEEPLPQNDQIAFTSVDPGVDAEHRFIRVEQPLVYGQPLRVTSERMGNVVHVDTENVALVRVTSTTPGEESVYVLDGATVHVGSESSVWFRRTNDRWRVVAGPEPAPEKSAELSGPFKRAFDKRFVMVVGTKGTDEEDAALLQRARYDAQVWAYRGNGRAEIVTDVTFGLIEDYEGRNIILYGNRDTNYDWLTLVGASAHIQAQRGKLTVGDEEYEGDAYAAVFVRPRNDDPTALVGVFVDTGIPGARLGYQMLTFVSGVGYPDWTVFSPRVLHVGTPAVLEAGWYDARWRVQ